MLEVYLNAEKYIQIRERLGKYLSERFGYKKIIVSQGLTPNILIASSAKVDIYLRLMDAPILRHHSTIVIARIGFKQPKRGHGTDMLRFLASIASEYNYEIIEMEACNEMSAAFSIKMGFEPKPYTYYDYSITTAALLANFKDSITSASAGV